jgi:hypothetical protein
MCRTCTGKNFSIPGPEVLARKRAAQRSLPGGSKAVLPANGNTNLPLAQLPQLRFRTQNTNRAGKPNSVSSPGRRAVLPVGGSTGPTEQNIWYKNTLYENCNNLRTETPIEMKSNLLENLKNQHERFFQEYRGEEPLYVKTGKTSYIKNATSFSYEIRFR